MGDYVCDVRTLAQTINLQAHSLCDLRMTEGVIEVHSFSSLTLQQWVENQTKLLLSKTLSCRPLNSFGYVAPDLARILVVRTWNDTNTYDALTKSQFSPYFVMQIPSFKSLGIVMNAATGVNMWTYLCSKVKFSVTLANYAFPVINRLGIVMI